MTLTPGHRLGPYEILGALGAGGMGEVYRARDTRLGRTVAVKILPDVSIDQKPRFEREARAIANLTHPHICTLYDVGRHDSTEYLVMELLLGQTLAARLREGPVAYSDVLKFGLQIAQALATAHRAGIVHRDLKPSNIMLTAAGAKLLDFGVAKLQSAPASSLATMTEPAPLTGSGTLVGTLQYMAPEQLEGRDADPRSDLFAFGAILFEMITGRRAFAGSGPASIIAAILASEPDISEIEARAPSGFVDLVKTCLIKNPEERRQSAHDIVLQLQWLARQPAAAVAGTTMPAGPRGVRRRWAGAAVLAAAVGGLAAGFLISGERAMPPMRVSILPPANEPQLSLFAISPDATRLVFSAPASSGDTMLWIRPLSSPEPLVVPGTEGAANPFWSPDGRSIGFFAGGKLKVVGAQLGSGPPPIRVLADAPEARGGTWSPAGAIVFARNIEDGLYRVDASGGAVTPVTTLDRSRRENSHRWPQFLPDGRRLLFFARGIPEHQGLYVGTPGSSDWKLLLRTPAAGTVVALPARTWLARLAGRTEGRLLFTEDETLMVQPFDLEALELRGRPSPVAQRIRIQNNAGLFTVSSGAALAYRAASDGPSHAWVDRAGRLLDAVGTSEYSPRISPDGRHIAFVRIDHQTGSGDIWVTDVARGIATRLTDEPSYEWLPVWSPDGTEVMYASNGHGPMDLFARPIIGSRPERQVLASGNRKTPTHWSRSAGDDVLLYQEEHPTRGWDLMALATNRGAEPQPILTTRFNERDAVLSPDGTWVAYASDETGQYRVYVRSFSLDAASRVPVVGRPWPISPETGTIPQWGRNGRELFYLGTDEKIMAVPIKAEAPFDPGRPVPLFRLAGGEWFDVAADGKRFLTVSPDAARAVPVTLFLNWADALDQ